MATDPKWWEERAKALAEGDTWPRTNKPKSVKEEEVIEEGKIT